MEREQGGVKKVRERRGEGRRVGAKEGGNGVGSRVQGQEDGIGEGGWADGIVHARENGEI